MTICDGCGMLSVCKRGVCAMCRADGVPMRETATHRRKHEASPRLPAAPDNFPTMARERARCAAIRAEDPQGWAEALGTTVRA